MNRPRLQHTHGPTLIRYTRSSKRHQTVCQGDGIDRHAIAKIAMVGLGKALWSFVPPGAKDHSTLRTSSPTTRRRRRPCSRLSQEVQRYIVGNMVQMNATTLPFVQAARDHVKGYVFERGYKFRFATTWLDKPQK